jgi:hypothetical protein
MDPRWAPVRVGDTVRRPAGSARAGVRALLLHLEAVGFDGAPRHLGTDEHGREILSWVEGNVPVPPYPAWAMTELALADLGLLVRGFHEATASFVPPADPDWATDWADPTGAPATAPGVGRVIAHNDLFPENVVFRDGRVVALIDFAMAAPGRPLWDLAIAAELWCPLGDPERRDQHPPDLDSGRSEGRSWSTSSWRNAPMPTQTSGPRSPPETNRGSPTGRRPAATIERPRTTPGSPPIATR